jgi:hypothetical protein
MSRRRRPQDWERDLAAARAAEAALAERLRADPRLDGFADHTSAFDRLDFSFVYSGLPVQVDLKEKIRPTSRGLAALWSAVPPQHLFVLDETVYRRIVWHGGGGYLIVHDHPGSRWAIFGPWELTLGPRTRYRRFGETETSSFFKGKILLDLRAAARSAADFSVDDLLAVIEASRAQRDSVDAVVAADLPSVGAPGDVTPPR